MRAIGEFQIRANSEPVTFLDDTVPERLAQTLAKARKQQLLTFGRGVFDCYRFTAAMRGLPLDNESAFGFGIGDSPVTVYDTPETDVVLGVKTHGLKIVPTHMTAPAHQIAGGVLQPMYLHKLGIKYPVCMTGFSETMRLTGSKVAYPAIRPGDRHQ